MDAEVFVDYCNLNFDGASGLDLLPKSLGTAHGHVLEIELGLDAQNLGGNSL